MRAVIQRVSSASVKVGSELVSSINRGVCVLIGISRDDKLSDMEFIVRKILNLRLFNGPDDKPWDKSVKDLGLEVLCVSQFTLYGQLKGNKIDYHLAMKPEEAENFYNTFLRNLRTQYVPENVKDGVFGAYMQVSIENDGPVTINIESKSTSASNNE